MSIYGENEIFTGAAGKAAVAGLERRTQRNAQISHIRFFEKSASKSMVDVAIDTSLASRAYKVTLSETAHRLMSNSKGGIFTALAR
ncbi:MAG: hypothetical protein H7832_06520 [Magnetococcus sp. DMHC-6]